MIERYSREEMRKIWDLNSKFNYYLQVELAVCDAYVETGDFPKEDIETLKKLAKFDIKRIDEIEQEVKHDVIAFLTNVNENVGEYAKYVHVGMTSSDVIDTAFALQIQDSGKIILDGLNKTINSLKNLAKKHKNTVCVGRSHGIHAEVMTFCVKLCSWIDILTRQRDNFIHALEEIRVGQISGPVGTYSNISPEIEEITCKNLELKPAKILEKKLIIGIKIPQGILSLSLKTFLIILLGEEKPQSAIIPRTFLGSSILLDIRTVLAPRDIPCKYISILGPNNLDI